MLKLILTLLASTSIYQVGVSGPIASQEQSEQFAITRRALALRCLPLHQQDDFALLRELLETKYPQYRIVFVNEKEELIGLDFEWTPLSIQGLRVWARAA